MNLCHLPKTGMEHPNSNESGGYLHVSVLPDEILKLIAPRQGDLIVDGTLGGGGHTELFLQAGVRVIGLDQDQDALDNTSRRLANFGDAFRPVKANFRDLSSVLKDLGVEKIDGLLLDIGVSSHQLNTAERGFSFQADGPLDMRMDRAASTSAAELVNESSLEDLIQIFRNYGEEPSAFKIAKRILELRTSQPFETTTQLANAVESVKPRRGKKHPATQIFQALRMAVNDELGALEKALEAAPALLNPGARFGVITFHSLEDRLVKNNFRRFSTPTFDRPEWPAPRPNPAYVYNLVNRKSITASDAEISRNPRSRSARLRVVKKLEEVSHVS